MSTTEIDPDVMRCPDRGASLYEVWAGNPTWMIEANIQSEVINLVQLAEAGRDPTDSDLIGLAMARRELAWRLAHGEQLGRHLGCRTFGDAYTPLMIDAASLPCVRSWVAP